MCFPACSVVQAGLLSKKSAATHKCHDFDAVSVLQDCVSVLFPRHNGLVSLNSTISAADFELHEQVRYGASLQQLPRTAVELNADVGCWHS